MVEPAGRKTQNTLAELGGRNQVTGYEQDQDVANDD
jgi:hypothetical protein